MRQWIWNALCEVIIKGVYSNLYLKDHLQQLDAKDRALATRIFYGTLQNYEYCTYVWKQFADKKVSRKVGVLLGMSAYQLLFLDKVPDYAIINDAVNLAKRFARSDASFVNAVLRKVASERIKMPENELEAEALRHSVPLWLYKMWIAQYGKQKADALLKSANESLPVYVRANPVALKGEELPERFEKTEDGLYIYHGQTLFEDPYFKEGKVSAMDPGSYEIARYTRVRPEDQVLDICAAPGTKSMAMAEMMNDQGSVTSLDLHPHRVKLIENDARRLGLSCIHSMCKDSTNLDFDHDFDVVLCDVPCSGYGVLARKPDLKLRLKPEDMDTLIPLQKKLLESASRYVSRQGCLVYSTCTINKKENEKQVESFLKEHPEYELEEMQTLFPSENRDGFFMARMKRKKDMQDEKHL